MTLDLTCQACDTSFELDVADLLDEPRLQCPGCEARAPRATAEALSSVVDELLGQVSRLRAKFQVILEVESEDLPPPYDRVGARAGEDEEEAEPLEEEDAVVREREDE